MLLFPDYADKRATNSFCRLSLCCTTIFLCDLIEYASQVGDWGLDASKQLSKKNFSGWNGCDNLGSSLIIVGSFNYRSLQFQLRSGLSEFSQNSSWCCSIILRYS